MFRPFADWLEETPLSKALQTHDWIIPTSQSIHILAVSIVFASACMLNWRLLGARRSGRSTLQLSGSLLPRMWYGLAVLLLTGLVQTIAEPVRQFVTVVFWAKMVMLIIVVAITAQYMKTVRSSAAEWDDDSSRPPGGRTFAVASILLWLAIITCGRFIGYTSIS
jgi:hypothetical protein